MEKVSKDFYDLCYDQYKSELEEAEKIYQKVSILLVLIPILAGVSAKFGRTDIIPSFFARVDIFLYYLSFIITWLLLGVSISFSIYCVMPRKKYRRIKDMENWQDWRVRYQKYIDESGNDEDVDHALIRDLTPRLAEAQTTNTKLNEKRRQAFQKAVFITSLSIFSIGFQALLYLALKLQNI